MNTRVKQMYGLMNDSYYEFAESNNIVIPQNGDYTSDAMQTYYDESINQCTVDLYKYHSDLITTCNMNRVVYMKEFLLNEKIKEMIKVNDDYVVSLTYTLYNRDGKIISSGEVSTKAKFCNAIINSDVNEDNIMEYRKAFVFDGRFEITVPSIARYGIKNSCIQHPYTIKFDKLSVFSTVGEYEYGILSDEQVMCRPEYHHAHHMNYERFTPDGLAQNNFSSVFLTNAKVGTTIIDSTVVSTKLEIPAKYEKVPIVGIPLDNCIVTIDRKVNLFVVNTEVLLDNFCIVYDKNDIDQLIELNNQEDTTCPDPGCGEEDTTPPADNTENPSDTETGDGTVDDTTPDPGTSDENGDTTPPADNTGESTGETTGDENVDSGTTV